MSTTNISQKNNITLLNTPANTQSTNTQLKNSQPANTPTLNKTTINKPTINAPSNVQPAITQPANTQPANTQPANTPTNKPANTSANIKLSNNNNKNNKSTPVNTSNKQVSYNNAINKYESNKKINESNKLLNENIKTTKKEMIDYDTFMTDNYLLLLGITSALVLCLFIYLFSESFRVGRTINKMIVYQGFQRITSINYIKLGDLRLGDMYVSSAYNSSHSGYQMYDYTSEKIVLSVLQSGVRYLEFNVFNSVFGDNAYPVVSMGYKKGEWKMMVKDTPLEYIFQIIAENAFKVHDGVEGVFNSDDPIFIGLNLNTNSNLSSLNLLGFLITKYFRNRLLPNKYSFQNSDDIADIKLTNLMGKVVFFSSDGFQGSGLEEIINYSWDNIDNNPNHNLQRIHYSKLLEPTFDEKKLINFNRKGLTIVVPHNEGDFFNTNFNPIKAFECGCQFVAMEFQYIDSNMDMYITKFKNKSMLLKDAKIRKDSQNNQTINDESINDESINDEAINDESINDESINDEAINDESINDEAINDDK